MVSAYGVDGLSLLSKSDFTVGHAAVLLGHGGGGKHENSENSELSHCLSCLIIILC